MVYCKRSDGRHENEGRQRSTQVRSDHENPGVASKNDRFQSVIYDTQKLIWRVSDHAPGRCYVMTQPVRRSPPPLIWNEALLATGSTSGPSGCGSSGKGGGIRGRVRDCQSQWDGWQFEPSSGHRLYFGTGCLALEIREVDIVTDKMGVED